MRLTLCLVVTCLLFSGLPSAAQDVQGPSWEMGWVTDVDPKFVVELEEDWDVTGSLVVTLATTALQN